MRSFGRQLYAGAKCAPGACRTVRECLYAWAVHSLILTLLFVALQGWKDDIPGVRKTEDAAMDAVFQLNANRDPPRSHVMPPIELYDIDEASYRAWGSPVFTPRDKLLRLIQRASRAGASVIMVDIDLARPSTGVLGAEDAALSPADRELGEYLARINESTDPAHPVVILTRTFRWPLDAQGRAATGALMEPVPSFLDAYVPQQKRVFWGSPLFSVDPDRMLRRWRLAELYCDSGGRLAIVPSVQLLVVIAQNYAQESGRALAADAVRRTLEQLGTLVRGAPCSAARDSGPVHDYLRRHARELPRAASVIMLSPADQQKWVDLAAGGDAERVIYRVAPIHEIGQKTQIALSSAEMLLAPTEPRLDADGRIVLIGGTFDESGDFHRTPLASRMPGVYVLANAIDTLAYYGQFRAPPLWLSVGVLCAATLLLHLVFSLFPVLIGKLVAMVVLTGFLFVLSVAIFSYGVGFTYALPLFILQVVYMITIVVHARRKAH